MPITLSHVITSARATLADPGNVHWTAAELVAYLNEALGAVAGWRPDAFTATVTLALVPGSEQTLPPEYIDVVDVTGSVGDDGLDETTGVTRAASDIGARLRGKFTCLNATLSVDGPGPYGPVRGFRIKPQARGQFTVSPPVPDGETPEIQAVVYINPPIVAEADLDTLYPHMNHTYLPTLTNYVLMRAFEKDVESVEAARRAEFYRSQVQFLNISSYRGAQRFQGGYINGRQGDGYENTGRVAENRVMT